MAKKNNVTEVLGIWEEIYNPNFNSPEFEGIKNQTGLKRFVLSVKPIAQQAASQFEIKIRQQAVAQLTQIPRRYN